MAVYTKKITLTTQGQADIIDITERIAYVLSEVGVKDGIVTVFVPGATAAVTTIEYESGVLHDLKAAINRAMPEEIEYKHDLRWHDGNGHSHVRAAWFGPDITVPFKDKNLLLGTWQQIVLIDFDNHPRQRSLILQIIGE